MCTVSKMTFVVLCIFFVAVGSQLSRLGELRYVPTTVMSLMSSRSTADATMSHWFNGTTALTAPGTTAATLLPSISANPHGAHVKIIQTLVCC